MSTKQKSFGKPNCPWVRELTQNHNDTQNHSQKGEGDRGSGQRVLVWCFRNFAFYSDKVPKMCLFWPKYQILGVGIFSERLVFFHSNLVFSPGIWYFSLRFGIFSHNLVFFQNIWYDNNINGHIYTAQEYWNAAAADGWLAAGVVVVSGWRRRVLAGHNFFSSSWKQPAPSAQTVLLQIAAVNIPVLFVFLVFQS